jgi:hypothetical protein
MYGITIEIDIDKTSSLEQLALSDVLTRSYDDIEDTIIQLKELGCDFILICDNSFAGASERSFGAVRSCKKHQIPYETNSRTNKDISVETKNYKFPALLNIGLWITSRQYFAKIIHFGNSTPIYIK